MVYMWRKQYHDNLWERFLFAMSNILYDDNDQNQEVEQQNQEVEQFTNFFDLLNT